MSYNDLPHELRGLKQWGVFHKVWQPEKEKFTKIPIDPHTGKNGKSNDQSTWSDFVTALNALEHYEKADGLAFYFANGYVGIDIDNVQTDLERHLEGDVHDNVVTEFMVSTQSYTERSLSGKGIHIIAKANLPEGQRRHKNFEMYDSGRFFAITADVLSHSDDVMEIPDEVIDRLHKKYFQTRRKKDAVVVSEFQVSERVETNDLINTMLGSANGVQIKSLLYGGWEEHYASQSEADMGLANYLAFWTARDFAQMDEIFRMSALMRDKFDAKRGKTTYGVGLLNKAIAEQNDIFTGKVEKRELQDSELPAFLRNDAPVETAESPSTASDDSPIKRYFSYDDTGLAERFVYHFGKNFLYDTLNKQTLFYDGQTWQVDNYRLLEKTMTETVNRIKLEPVFEIAAEEQGATKTPDELRAAFIKKSRSNSAKKNAIAELQNMIAVTADDFDNEMSLLNTPSGLVDLSSGEVTDSGPEDRLTKITGVEYTDTMTPERWLGFLKQTFKGNEELIPFVQKAVGYAATGTMDEEVMFILFGKGKNGKSVFMNTIDYVLGSYSINVDPETIMTKRTNGGPSGDIARMKGARVMVLSEPDEGKALAEGLVKKITSKDVVTARKMYGSEFEFRPTGTIFMMTNHKPVIKGTDDGIWRRLMFVPFKNQVTAEQMDKKLEDKLKTEAPGILNWILEGALKWQQEGLTPPPVVMAETNEYRKESDVVEMFLEEFTSPAVGLRVESKDIISLYNEWEYLNRTGFSTAKLTRELGQRYKKIRSNGKTYYMGLMFKDHVMPSAPALLVPGDVPTAEAVSF